MHHKHVAELALAQLDRGLAHALLVQSDLGSVAHLDTEADIGTLVWLAFQSDTTAQALSELLCCGQTYTDTLRLERAQLALAKSREEVLKDSGLDSSSRITHLRQQIAPSPFGLVSVGSTANHCLLWIVVKEQ